MYSDEFTVKSICVFLGKFTQEYIIFLCFFPWFLYFSLHQCVICFLFPRDWRADGLETNPPAWLTRAHSCEN